MRAIYIHNGKVIAQGEIVGEERTTVWKFERVETKTAKGEIMVSYREIPGSSQVILHYKVKEAENFYTLWNSSMTEILPD
jgi:hypothetical protein